VFGFGGQKRSSCLLFGGLICNEVTSTDRDALK